MIPHSRIHPGPTFVCAAPGGPDSGGPYTHDWNAGDGSPTVIPEMNHPGRSAPWSMRRARPRAFQAVPRTS